VGVRPIDREFWKGKRVFVTGHMGFKGAWLCSLLAHMGVESIGFGRDERECLLYTELNLAGHSHHLGDINDLPALTAALSDSRADILFHLAAQPIVLASYADPVDTFETNVMGTVRVLEAARKAKDLRAIVVVTSDKVYRNNEWAWSYREQDALGGADPYSASKAAAEIATEAMVRSFFAHDNAPQVATARAGNVIGGGDWADYRLLPDAARAISAGQSLIVRHPQSTRPWQHVLDPLAGYLMLAQSLADGRTVCKSWNFGPAQEEVMTVREVADLFVTSWGSGAVWTAAAETVDSKHEAGMLTIDSSLARRELGWHPRWRSEEAIRRTAVWYRDRSAGERASVLVERDLIDFFSK
jgi:CDP-glucose 4,6-dehydratase